VSAARVVATCAGTLFAATLALAQAPDLAGTWRLDLDVSNVDAAVSLDGLSGTTETETLHITQPANRTVMIESSMRQSQARLYQPGGKTSNRILLGEPGTLTLESKWEGQSLVSEGLREFSAGDAKPVAVSEVIRLRDNGETLEIVVTASTADGPKTSTLLYKKAPSLGPCESWPSPCKRPGAQDP